MKFYIETINDNGSGMTYKTKEEFLNEVSLMIDDCITNGGTFFDIQVDSDASCFYEEEVKKNLQDIEKCKYRDITDTYYDEYYERDTYYCKHCKCYMDKQEECLKDCPLY